MESGKSPRLPRSMHIMDTVSGRISGDSTASGDAFIEIDQRINNGRKSHNHLSASGSQALQCSNMDNFRAKQTALERYGNGKNIKNGSKESLNGKKVRFIKKSGHCNVSHAHLHDKPRRFLADLFTTCVDLRWRWNLLLFGTAFIVSWIFFGFVYWIISFAHGDFAELKGDRPEMGCINNLDPNTSFTSAFLFSLETQTTIGYGFRVVTEACPSAIIAVVVQSVFGCIVDAFMIGLIMAKISRPKKRAETLLFSKKAVINVRDGKLCLMVRVGNLRKSHLVEATIRMQFLYSRTTLEGEFIPLEQIDLHLDLKNDSDRLFLVTPQTICHPIDSDSPLYHMNKETLQNSQFEIIVILEGMVEATGMTTQARASYLPEEIEWGHRFENVITFSHSNGYHVNFKKFDNTNPTSDAPICSAAELSNPELMIKGESNDGVKRRSIASSTKMIREDSNVSDGRDSGYTPVEDDEEPPPFSAKTYSRSRDNSVRLASNSSAESVNDAKRRSWPRERQRDSEPKELEEKAGETVFLTTVEETSFNRKKRKSAEIAAQITREQNLKNSELSTVENPTDSKRPVKLIPSAVRVSPNDEITPANQGDVTAEDKKIELKPNVTSPKSSPVTSVEQNEIVSDTENKTILAVEPVPKNNDERVCLLDESDTTVTLVLDNVPNGIRHADSPV